MIQTVFPSWSNMFPDYFSKIRVQGASIFDKGPKSLSETGVVLLKVK